MSIETLFPPISLSQTEIDVIADIFQNAAVRKYLHYLALQEGKDLLSLSASHLPPEKLALAHENIRGKLAVLSTLMEIAEPPVSQLVSQSESQ